MSYFNPYTSYASRLPVLKPGHYLKIGKDFYLIKAVRRNRPKITLPTDAKTDYVLATTTDESYAAVNGKIDTGRVIHIQYMALSESLACKFKWGTEGLLSKWVATELDNTNANLNAPIEVDRWTYDTPMAIKVTKGEGSQTLYFEVIEYEVVPTERKPKTYLYVLPNGHAMFVQAE